LARSTSGGGGTIIKPINNSSSVQTVQNLYVSGNIGVSGSISATGSLGCNGNINTTGSINSSQSIYATETIFGRFYSTIYAAMTVPISGTTSSNITFDVNNPITSSGLTIDNITTTRPSTNLEPNASYIVTITGNGSNVIINAMYYVFTGNSNTGCDTISVIQNWYRYDGISNGSLSISSLGIGSVTDGAAGSYVRFTFSPNNSNIGINGSFEINFIRIG
jgi:hypothetical protein